MLLPTNNNVIYTTSTSTSIGAQSAASSTSPEETLSRQYDVRPQTLDALVDNRKRLATSENDAAKALGAALEKVHKQLANDEISPRQHKDKCNDIREAADMIVGFIDVENDVLAKFGLKGKCNLELRSDEHLA